VTTAAAPAIDVRGLRKVYGSGERAVVAVDGLDVRVERGEVFGLLGPNGAGKTTTVEICEGLLAPTAGEVEVLGWSYARNERAIRERIGVSLQETVFFDKQTIRELIRLFCSFYTDARPVDEVIELVSLQQKADARYASLSGGQKQRLAVACALVGRPDLLFLDEPTTGLDPQSRRSLWEVVREFRRQGGTVVLTTHYMEEAAALCERVMIVDGGRSIALGTPRELVASLGAGHVIEVRAAGLAAVDPRALRAVPSVQDVAVDNDRLTLTVGEVHTALPAVLELATASRVELEDLTLRHTTLEDVFVHLTGRQLREDGAP
jgi:ABC-2 type transport system ATP-binding protein